jgi:hypothetical protein
MHNRDFPGREGADGDVRKTKRHLRQEAAFIGSYRDRAAECRIT